MVCSLLRASLAPLFGAALALVSSSASAEELEQGPVIAQPGFMMRAGSWKQAAAAQGKTFVVYHAASKSFYDEHHNRLNPAVLEKVLPNAFVAVQPHNVFADAGEKWPAFEEALDKVHAIVPKLAIGVQTHSQGGHVVLPNLVGYLKARPDVHVGNVHINAPLTNGSVMADVGARAFPLASGRRASAEMQSGKTDLAPAINELQGLVHGEVSMATPTSARTALRASGRLSVAKGGDGFVTRATNTVAGVRNVAIRRPGGENGLWRNVLAKTPAAHLGSIQGAESTTIAAAAMQKPLRQPGAVQATNGKR